jgi:hypothetical protein
MKTATLFQRLGILPKAYTLLIRKLLFRHPLLLAETVTNYQFWRKRNAFQARMCKQRDIQRPLNAFVQNTDKGDIQRRDNASNQN